MNDQLYWIWLSRALGAGARTDEILCAFPHPRMLYEANRTTRLLAGVFTKAQMERLEATPLEAAAQIADLCARNGWQIYTPQDAGYPAQLQSLVDQPLALYSDGALEALDLRVAIGVVGTRKPTLESVNIARRICADMAAAGAVIVSGGALGIDSAAHEGALLAGGPTVCVMGCGLGTDYLRENEALRREIRANGALVTEYPPFTPASRYTFPTRNRLISGMSLGVLVVEAGERSGSLITAHRANEQGREVFAIPGSVLTTAYKGANSLIRDGAKAVTCARDVLAAFAMMYPDRLDLTKTGPLATEPPAAPQTQPAAQTPAQPAVSEAPAAEKTKKVPAAPLDPDAARVYNLFGGTPLHPDEIAAATGLSPAQLIPVLLQLTLADLIAPTDGGCYTLA
ncbi:MAG: DNA-processing protein DprA [Clostridia bacterium]|nr:DNA-processing protein DprA [Clostridia bacterium]